MVLRSRIIAGTLIALSAFVGIRVGIFVHKNVFVSILSLQNNQEFVASVGLTAIVEKESVESVNILAFGDMMLDRNIRKYINKNGAEYPFSLIKDFLVGNDVVVVNAEGPFTTNTSKTLNVKNGPLVFTFDQDILPTLKKLGFTLLSQANNHTLNFGTKGFKESADNIEKAGINWFGDPSNKEPHTFITTIKGQKIAFVGYHQFIHGSSTEVLSDIKSAKEQGAFVIVYPHWGTEYKIGFDVTQNKFAHLFVDAGADAVLGSHPHVIEPVEIYKGKAIFYSMGNFIFDQSINGPTSEGLSIGLSISTSSVSYYLYPLKIKAGQAFLMQGDDRLRVLGDIAKISNVATSTKESIKNGEIYLSLPIF